MSEGNELDSTCGISDEELTERFKESIRIDQEICKVKGLPIAGYDDENKCAYLEYPDGRRVYVKEEQASWNHHFCRSKRQGKTTITRMARNIGVYINADDIKRSSLCSDLEAAVKAEELREEMVEKGEDFIWNSVLYWLNIKLLKKAKEKGYF